MLTADFLKKCEFGIFETLRISKIMDGEIGLLKILRM